MELKELQTIKNDFDVTKNDLNSRIENVEKAVAEYNDLIRSGEKDEATQVKETILAYLQGNEDIVRALPSGLLSSDALDRLVPAVVGDDFASVCKVKRTSAMTTSIGVAPTGTLATGLSSATDWAPTALTVTLKNHGGYHSFSQSEADTATIDTAFEIAENHVARRNATFKANFVDGDGTYFKGLKDYTAETTFANLGTGEVFNVAVGAADTATVAQIYTGILSAANQIVEGDKCVVMNGTLIGSFATTADDNNHYYLDLLKNFGFQVVRNDSMESVGGSNIVAAVMVKNRGYGIGLAQKPVVTRDTTADTVNLYIGENMGGGILDQKAIATISVVPS